MNNHGKYLEYVVELIIKNTVKVKKNLFLVKITNPTELFKTISQLASIWPYSGG